jgi:hypothetical protein
MILFHSKDLKFRLIIFGAALLVNIFLNLPSFFNWDTDQTEVTANRIDSIICSQAWIQASNPSAPFDFSFGLAPAVASSSSPVRDQFFVFMHHQICLKNRSKNQLIFSNEDSGHFDSYASIKSRGPPLKKSFV